MSDQDVLNSICECLRDLEGKEAGKGVQERSLCGEYASFRVTLDDVTNTPQVSMV